MFAAWDLKRDDHGNMILIGKDKNRGSLVYAQVLWQSGFSKRGWHWLSFYTADGIRYRVPFMRET
jgi:hypothetical protein